MTDDHLTIREVAIRMGVKLNTLRSRIYRAQHSATRAGKRRTESSLRQHGWKPGGNGQSLGDRCPKCGGPVYHSGGVVLSRSANIDRCIMCGLTSESMSFYDAVNCRRVDIKTALVLMRLNSS